MRRVCTTEAICARSGCTSSHAVSFIGPGPWPAWHPPHRALKIGSTSWWYVSPAATDASGAVGSLQYRARG
jgi:hypothetical protein